MSFIGTVGLANVFGFFSAVIVFAVMLRSARMVLRPTSALGLDHAHDSQLQSGRMDHQFSLSSEALGRGLRRHANHLINHD